MGLEPVTTQLTSGKPIDQLRADLVAALGEMGAKVEDDQGTIRARSGMGKVTSRIAFGHWMRDRSWPVDHTIILTPEGAETGVAITVSQAFGKGLTGVGIRDRYERILGEHMDELVAALS